MMTINYAFCFTEDYVLYDTIGWHTLQRLKLLHLVVKGKVLSPNVDCPLEEIVICASPISPVCKPRLESSLAVINVIAIY